MSCDVAIIGGGVAGTYLAMRLGEERNNICLFEKELRLGGRCQTVESKDNFNRSTHFGIGARRLLKKGTHAEFCMKLADELNITMEMPEEEEEVVFARGEYHLSSSGSNAFAHLYPNLPLDNRSKLSASSQLYNKLFQINEK